VLLVEDDEGDAVLVRACLAETGVAPEAVIWSHTAADALQQLTQNPSCILLDLGLPDADGLGALLRIVDAAPDIPVIVLTGRQALGGVDALAVGAQDYLVKDDINADLLDRSIRYAVERKRAQRTSQELRDAPTADPAAAHQRRRVRHLLPTGPRPRRARR
jgi:CheY-like chemotaxis protein